MYIKIKLKTGVLGEFVYEDPQLWLQKVSNMKKGALKFSVVQTMTRCNLKSHAFVVIPDAGMTICSSS